jgi:hypothetical protein
VPGLPGTLCGVTAEAGFEEEDDMAAIDRYGMSADVGFPIKEGSLAVVARRNSGRLVDVPRSISGADRLEEIILSVGL